MQHFYMDMSNCRHKASKEVLTKVNTSHCINSCVWTDLCSCTLSGKPFVPEWPCKRNIVFLGLGVPSQIFHTHCITVQTQFLDITKICQLPGISTEQDSVYLSAIDNMHI